MVKEIVDLTELQELIKSKNLTVVDFYATWCGPCKRIAPLIEKMCENKSYANVNFVKVDVDEAPAIVDEYKIQHMPTFIFFKNNKQVDRYSNSSYPLLLKTIKQYMNTESDQESGQESDQESGQESESESESEQGPGSGQ